MTSGITLLTQVRPDTARALDGALDAAYAACPDGLLDLCRARIRSLLGTEVTSEDPQQLAVADYAKSELFNDTERLALEFTEQYVLDVANMPDELVGALRERLGNPALYALVMGLYAIDQAERLDISVGVHPMHSTVTA